MSFAIEKKKKKYNREIFSLSLAAILSFRWEINIV